MDRVRWRRWIVRIHGSPIAFEELTCNRGDFFGRVARPLRGGVWWALFEKMVDIEVFSRENHTVQKHFTRRVDAKRWVERLVLNPEKAKGERRWDPYDWM